MARRRLSTPGSGTLVLDSQGLSLLADRDAAVVRRVEAARLRGAVVIASTLTLVEVRRPDGPRHEALAWAASHIRIVAVTEDIAKRAAALLDETGLDGHRYAVDAVVAATALEQPRPVLVLTSDPEDLAVLTTEPGVPPQRRVKPVKV